MQISPTEFEVSNPEAAATTTPVPLFAETVLLPSVALLPFTKMPPAPFLFTRLPRADTCVPSILIPYSPLVCTAELTIELPVALAPNQTPCPPFGTLVGDDALNWASPTPTFCKVVPALLQKMPTPSLPATWTVVAPALPITTYGVLPL